MHIPVLLHETIRELEIKDKEIILDSTLGGAGHIKALIEGKAGVTLIGLDADGVALENAREGLKALVGKNLERLILEKENFRNLDKVLEQHEINKIDKALFDLGVGSHTYESGRGFSFQKDEPLLMTLDDQGGVTTARTVVNEWREESLSDIIYGFGEEKFSRRIAKAIVKSREKKPIETSAELEKIIYAAVPLRARHGRIHPATKTFQAIRIAVNDELGALTEGLNKAWKYLGKAGKIAVISFHSLEDRIVKNLFKNWEVAGEGRLTSKKPIVPTEEEIINNPRSRSAKLRIIEKLS